MGEASWNGAMDVVVYCREDCQESRVMRDYLDARMVAQPGCEGVGRTIGQEIDRLMLFEVNQNRSVDSAFLQREIVHAQYPWRHRHDRFRLADKPQEGIVAHPHPQFGGKPGTRLPTKGIGHDL